MGKISVFGEYETVIGDLNQLNLGWVLRNQGEGFGGGGVFQLQGVSKKKSKGTRASLPDRCQPEKEGVRASATMKLLEEAEEATNNKKVKKEKNNFDFFYSHGQMQPL